MAVHRAQLGKLGARQHQKILGDGQVVHTHHPQLRVVITQVQHGGNVPGVAVFKGYYAVSGFARGHGFEHLVPCGIAHGFGVGEQRLEGDVGKCTFHSLIGGAVVPQHGSFVLLGKIHQVLDMVFIVRAQRGLLNAGCGLFQHGGLPGGIVDGQAVRPLIFGHL